MDEDNYPYTDNMLETLDGKAVSSFVTYKYIRNKINTAERYIKHYIATKYGVRVYSIVPESPIENSVLDDFYFFEPTVYSLIFGHIIIEDKNSHYDFYGTPETIMDCFRDYLLRYRVGYYYECPKQHEPIWDCFRNFHASIDMIYYLRSELGITGLIWCNSCNISIHNRSIGEVINIDEDFHSESTCPICGNKILTSTPEVNMARSFATWFNYECYQTILLEGNIPIEIRNYLIQLALKGTEFYERNSTIESLSDSICYKYLNMSGKDFLRIVHFSPDLVIEQLSSSENAKAFDIDNEANVSEIIEEVKGKFRGYKIQKLKQRK